MDSHPNAALDPITEWITETCRALSPFPGAVRVQEAMSNDEMLVIEIRPNPRNAGQILGREGATIAAIRLIANSMLRMRASYRSLFLHVVTEAKEDGATTGLPGSGRRGEDR